MIEISECYASRDNLILYENKEHLIIDDIFSKIDVKNIKLNFFKQNILIDYNIIYKNKIKLFLGNNCLKIKYKKINYELVFFKDFYGIKYKKRNSYIETKLHNIIWKLYKMEGIVQTKKEPYFIFKGFDFYNKTTLFKNYIYFIATYEELQKPKDI